MARGHKFAKLKFANHQNSSLQNFPLYGTCTLYCGTITEYNVYLRQIVNCCAV